MMAFFRLCRDRFLTMVAAFYLVSWHAMEPAETAQQWQILPSGERAILPTYTPNNIRC